MLQQLRPSPWNWLLIGQSRKSRYHRTSWSKATDYLRLQQQPSAAFCTRQFRSELRKTDWLFDLLSVPSFFAALLGLAVRRRSYQHQQKTLMSALETSKRFFNSQHQVRIKNLTDIWKRAYAMHHKNSENELNNIAGGLVVERIVGRAKEARYFTIIDETTDVFK